MTNESCLVAAFLPPNCEAVADAFVSLDPFLSFAAWGVRLSGVEEAHVVNGILA
jgi:hypothetical protein